MRMKTKRLLAMLLCISIIGSASAISALAAATGIVHSNNLYVSIDGYVDFLEGKLLYQDRVYYVASLSGRDMGMVGKRADSACYVQPYVEKKVIGKAVHLNQHIRLVSNTKGIKAGYGHEYARLKMMAAKTSKVISTK